MMITEIEDYFSRGCGRCERFDTPHCSAKTWQDGLFELRRVCTQLDLTETLKWAHPCYQFTGRNVAIIGAFRGDFRLSFFNAALMKDPNDVLEKQGPNTQYPDMIRFTSAQQVLVLSPVIESYLKEAMSYAEQGLLPPKTVAELELPEELLEVLSADPELNDAFHRLTPGRRKSYALNLMNAKKRETRFARIDKFRQKIIDGKGATER